MKVITEERLILLRNNLAETGKNKEACLIDYLITDVLKEIDTETVSNKPALDRFNEIEMEEESPLERLRFFCSLAMSGRDWLDSETFFDDLENVDALTVYKPEKE